MKEIMKDGLNIGVYETRPEMGRAAAQKTAALIAGLLQTQDEVNMIFAAAPSQNEMLAAFAASDVDFGRINAFHMDEYLGLAPGAPQRFSRYLDEHIFGLHSFKSIHYLGLSGDAGQEAARYTALLKEYPIDITLAGIGENGHIAFNDPHEADFNDPHLVRRVSLDLACRQQQVNDGCFARLEDVPEYALTLTIPALMAAKYIVATVPGPTKRAALTRAVTGEISPECPASVMRRHPGCYLFCDEESAKDLL